MARDPFDALFEEPNVAINESVNPAPPPPSKPVEIRRDPPATSPPRNVAPRRTPTDRDHLCDHPGCGKWGAFGLMPGIEVARSEWWCAEHRPQAWFEAGGETKKPLA